MHRLLKDFPAVLKEIDIIIKMKKEREKIKSVASTLCKAKEKGWHFITMNEFSYQTEVDKEEIVKILDLFKKAKILNYCFMPFDDETMRKDIFDRNANMQNPEGAVTFSPIHLLSNAESKKGDTQIEQFLKGNNFAEIKKISTSDEALDKFLKNISYTLTKPIFDKERRIIHYKDKGIKISAGNQTVICELLFSKPFGTVYNESDIILPDYVGIEKKGESQALYNSLWQINKKFERQTGITKLIKNRDGKTWMEIDSAKV